MKSTFQNTKGYSKMDTNKHVYLITNDNDYTKAIRMTEEQAKAIDWFISFFDLDFKFECPEDSEVDEI